MVDWQAVVDKSTELVKGYNASGIRPTLRQLHYRLASLQVGGYENTSNCYKALSRQLVQARKRDLIPWDGLADHIRRRDWNQLCPTIDFEKVLRSYVQILGIDPWKEQGTRVVIWLEKDALVDLVTDTARNFYVPVCVSRGYSSWTFIHDNLDLLNSDPQALVLYLGDHDPSGLDIERSLGEAVDYFDGGMYGGLPAGIGEALRSFGLAGGSPKITRVALTYDQVQQYGLLPNPTKKADSRSRSYVDRYGDQCWELDALDPATLRTLVTQAVERERDLGLWASTMNSNRQRRERILARLEGLNLDLDPDSE